MPSPSRTSPGHPVLADLAALIDGKPSGAAGCSRPLAEPGGPGRYCAGPTTVAGALVCFPYAGGNAVNFQAMASALRGSGLAVYAVELPGHDLAAEQRAVRAADQVVEQVTAEITQRGLTRVLLWGHSSGTAFAMETARKLEEHGVDVSSGCSWPRSCPVTPRTGAPPSAELTGRSQRRDRRRADRGQRLHRAR